MSFLKGYSVEHGHNHPGTIGFSMALFDYFPDLSVKLFVCVTLSC